MIGALGLGCWSLPVDWAESSLLVLEIELWPALGSLWSYLVTSLGQLRVNSVKALVISEDVVVVG